MRFIIFLLLIFSEIGVFCQSTPKDTLANELFAYSPDKVAKEAASIVVRYTGLAPNFIITENKNISTCIAYTKGANRFIAYNPDFIRKVYNKTQTDWGAVSIFAHEIGHHLLGHTVKLKGSNPGDELLADKFSGFILYNMGATLDETISAMQSIGENLDTLNHPPQSARIDVIKNGWLEAQKIRNTKAITDKEPPNNTDTIHFVYKCTFTSDHNVYLVDDKNRIIWHDNYGNPIIIGKRSESTEKGYAWIYNYRNSSFLVDDKGTIWNKTTYSAMLKIGKSEKILENR